ncbi:MAG: ParB/RepB/Spo0J family partition protein [Stenotrophobium sp.]
MSVKKRGLGRGLDALLGSANAAAASAEAGDELRELALDQLVAGRHQPRRDFDEVELAALADSIRAQGVVQPLLVRAAGAGKYEIVAGERRWRAARIAGLKEVPVVVRAMDERSAMAVALVENIQRADLNALEEAEALHKLIKECGLTHDKCAEAVGRSRAAVSNLLRLMELNADVQALLRANKLTPGHAKVLLAVEGERQSALAQRVVDGQLSVRQTEALVQSRPVQPAHAPQPVPHKLTALLTQRIGLPVKLQQNDKGRGKLVVAFKNQTELNRLLKLLGE